MPSGCGQLLATHGDILSRFSIMKLITFSVIPSIIERRMQISTLQSITTDEIKQIDGRTAFSRDTVTATFTDTGRTVSIRYVNTVDHAYWGIYLGLARNY